MNGIFGDFFEHQETKIIKIVDKQSKYKCVDYNKFKNKWTSKAKIDGKLKLLGYFDTEHEAYEAYTDVVPNNKNKISKYRGVSYDKRTNKWIARIFVNGKSKFLGNYSTELDAYKSYKEGRRRSRL